ncbi:MAG: 16S rRNA (cytosine(1402)-N(4))-methyltransferase, partial [Candidatus Omnitrophota bacterium]
MHRSVMVEEVLRYLNLAPGMVILDCTVGLGGHAKHILDSILPGGSLIGMDQDQETIELARHNLSDYKLSARLFYANFQNLGEVLKKADVGKVDGMLFDLGISSFQLEKCNRGFSIKHNAHLDMRMDRA